MAGQAERMRGEQKRRLMAEELRHIRHEVAPWFFESSLQQRTYRTRSAGGRIPYRMIGLSFIVLVVAGASVLWWEPISSAINGFLYAFRTTALAPPVIQPTDSVKEERRDTFTRGPVSPPPARQIRLAKQSDSTTGNRISTLDLSSQAAPDTVQPDTIPLPRKPAIVRPDSTVPRRIIQAHPDTTRTIVDTSSVGP